VAALDQMVGIGAEHGELPRSKLAQQIFIVPGRLGLVVEQAGADDKLGVPGIDARDVEAVEDRQVALWSEMEDAGAGVLGELVAGQVA
jgi:hypothetical protein